MFRVTWNCRTPRPPRHPTALAASAQLHLLAYSHRTISKHWRASRLSLDHLCSLLTLTSVVTSFLALNAIFTVMTLEFVSSAYISSLNLILPHLSSGYLYLEGY